MSNRFVDNVTPLNAATLNQFEDDLKAYVNDTIKQSLYVHNVQIVQGSGNNQMIGLLTLYTHSAEQLNTVSKVANALGITGNLCNVAMGGRYDISGGSYCYYNITTAAFVGASGITLRGHQIGYSDSSTGVVTYLNGSGNISITDLVSKVN